MKVTFGGGGGHYLFVTILTSVMLSSQKFFETTSSTKDPTSIQMNLAKGDKVTGRFNSQFKPMLSAGLFPGRAGQMTPFCDWPRPQHDNIVWK